MNSGHFKNFIVIYFAFLWLCKISQTLIPLSSTMKNFMFESSIFYIERGTVGEGSREINVLIVPWVVGQSETVTHL